MVRLGAIVGALALSAIGTAMAGAQWDAARPTQLRVDHLAVADALLSDVVLQMSEVLQVGVESTGRTRDHVDWQNRSLTLATLEAGGKTYHDVMVRVDSVLQVGKQEPLTEWLPSDPFFSQQWHLRNTGQVGQSGEPGKVGEDLRVTKAWQHVTGRGVRLALVDDGLDTTHPDLQVVPGQSWDFGSQAYGDPSSQSSYHGTATAGLAVAKGGNGLGVTGVAFEASVVGYNLLRYPGDANAAKAMTLDLDRNDIYINSFGAADGTGRLQKAGPAWSEAVQKGISLGRHGKGAIYVWAAGNGAPRDRSDYDGQANHPSVLAIAAVNSHGKQASYSEPGANVLVAAPGGDYCDTQSLLTTDVQGSPGFNSGSTYGYDLPGEPNYTRCMNGTSAATPLVAGVVALMLEANPMLGWRDVRALLALTARKNDPSHRGWVLNGAGRHVNDAYGFGVVDAFAAVLAAQRWQSLPPPVSVPIQPVGNRMPSRTALALDAQGQAVFEDTLRNESVDIRVLESVELFLQTDHPEVGLLTIELISPAGTSRKLMTPRECRLDSGVRSRCGAELVDGFRFSGAQWLGENPSGEWRLRVVDGTPSLSGTQSLSWVLKLHGVQ